MPEYKLPDVGEGLTEADIVSWAVAEGDTVAVNQQLCEIETAKSVVELPSPYAGQIHQLLVSEGTTVEVGAPIVVIDVDPGGQGLEGRGKERAADGVVLDQKDAGQAPGFVHGDAPAMGMLRRCRGRYYASC